MVRPRRDREPLGVPGEVTYPVPPLGLPADPTDPDAARRSDAVMLFVGRALAVRPTLAQDDANLVVAARICADRCAGCRATEFASWPARCCYWTSGRCAVAVWQCTSATGLL